jgi:hypothetical protein
MASGDRPARSLIIILSVIGALVIVALAIVLTRGEPAQLDESTPAGVVQRYYAAVVTGAEATPTSYLTEQIRSGCDRPDAADADDLTVNLVATKLRADSADVTVSLVRSTGNGPFGASEYQYEDSFDLVQENGAWRIERAPGQLTVCYNEGLSK